SRRCADRGSQPAAQLRPNKLQRSARKRSHSANTRTVPTPRTATFTHRLTIASENSRQPRVSGGEKSVTRAAHAAAITTTSARSRNRRLVIPRGCRLRKTATEARNRTIRVERREGRANTQFTVLTFWRWEQ